MRTVTSIFAAEITQSHQLAVLAEVIDSDGAETQVEVVDGTVTLDQQAAVRGRCDLTIVTDPDYDIQGLVPNSASSLLAPYGNEIQLSRGIAYADGTSEVVPLGVFRIQDAQVDDDPSGMQIKIAGQDRAARFIDARFEEPYQVAAGVNYGTAIEDVLQDAWPEVPTSFALTAQLAPSLIAQEGDDRWAFAQSMATAIAMDLYFDGDGVCVLAPVSLSDPVMTIAEGEDGVLVAAGRRWTREGAFNAVIATGENTGEAAPARGVARDDNPYSPTYYYGAFGKVPRFYSSPFLTTDAQAAAAAAKILADELGTTESVSFGSLVLPHLEPGDTVRITRARAGIDEDHLVDQLTVPLSSLGSMTGATRARQVVS